MGIMASCPNGHRIKVKEEFAGKKVVCPTCAARFRVPSAAALPTAGLLALDPAVVATLPAALPWTEPPAASVTLAAPPPPAQPSPLPPPATALHAALAERPELLWCIAFPGGEPTPPLPAESMQAWLDSGEADGTEVVWRSDWPEWRPAREVFPDALP